MVSQLHSLKWKLQEIPVPTEAACSAVLVCVNPCTRAVRGEKDSPAHTLTDSCARFVYEEL